MGQRSSLSSPESANPFAIKPMTGARNSTRLNYVPMGLVGRARAAGISNFASQVEPRADAPLRGCRTTTHRCRIFCSRLRRRIRFLRHFQRIFPRFFHARDERFIGLTAARIRRLLKQFLVSIVRVSREDGDGEAVYPWKGIWARGAHGQFSTPSKKHCEREPSTEGGRSRSDFDLSAHDRTRRTSRPGMSESRRRSRVMARYRRTVLRPVQELLHRESPSRIGALRRLARLRGFLRLAERSTRSQSHANDPTREIRGHVRRRKGPLRQSLRQDAQERRGRDWPGHSGTGQDVWLQLRAMESDDRGRHGRESRTAGVPREARRRSPVAARRGSSEGGQRNEAEVPLGWSREKAVRARRRDQR